MKETKVKHKNKETNKIAIAWKLLISIYSAKNAKEHDFGFPQFLRAVLRQDIGWYDTNTTSDFASKMTEDLNKIQDGIGEKMGMLVRFIVTFLGSLIYPYTVNWLISLVISSVIPVLAFFGALMAIIMTRISKNEMSTYGKAGKDEKIWLQNQSSVK